MIHIQVQALAVWWDRQKLRARLAYMLFENVQSVLPLYSPPFLGLAKRTYLSGYSESICLASADENSSFKGGEVVVIHDIQDLAVGWDSPKAVSKFSVDVC